MTDFLQNLGTIGCLGAEREAFATQLSATHTTRKSHVFAGTPESLVSNGQCNIRLGRLSCKVPPTLLQTN